MHLANDLQRLGGLAGLRPIITELVDRMRGDMMIGFYFRHTDRNQLIARELEHAAVFFGAPLRYQGRPLRAAHAKHRIKGGHFDRRLQLWRVVLTERGVPEDISERWLQHHQSLRSEITGDAPGECG